MEYLKISKLTEADFEDIFVRIGGSRYSPDHSREKTLNCDFKFRNALVELKLIDEEPAEKVTKQEKLAQIFERTAKTVVIDPYRLSKQDQTKYYRIIETPIKNALKTASKQLKTSACGDANIIKIAIIVNNGLSLMLPEEFDEVALKCARNDTSGIDVLIVCGLYFYCDRFDSFTFLNFEKHYLRKKAEDIVDIIHEEWAKFITEFMTRQLHEDNQPRDKEPLKDISFMLDDVLYVKPPPKWGKPSTFWRGGIRPREDSTGYTKCPPIASVLPTFESKAYDIAKASIFDDWRLRGSLTDYKNWQQKEVLQHINSLRPLVPVEIPADLASAKSYKDLTQIAIDIFHTRIRQLIEKSSEYSDQHQSLDYILLSSIEIGLDKANDIAFISHEMEFPGIEKSLTFIDGERLKFEHALGLAAAHCVRVGANCIYYEKDETYKWV
ncbi:hypothetical protein KIP69_02850 [Geobacter sulfurreducens]|uniref:hypothetical protein n=1 Tax=Geobacter sulfurreducens TaxID=35554 RepID=UPI001BDBC6B3|nr:hypothetical protein [Geobacter sulfurreducens]QVW35809.1 hypothetical protein KIP69_02850 [Geobacter sulfurreducens]